MKLVFLESALISLPILKVLCALAIEHAVVPVTFVLPVATLPIENAPAALNSVSKLSLVPTAVAPPESAPAVALACLELALINITFLSSPVVDTSSFLFVKSKLANVVVTCCEVELSLSF